MPEAIKWRDKIILFKVETTYGTDAVPTGAANAMLMTNVEFSPMEGDDTSRNLELPYLGGQEQIPTGLRGVLTGSTELAGSGTAGTAPAWGALARACALAEAISAGASVTYSPVSDTHESGTLYFLIGNTRHVLTGCRGTAVLSISAQGIPSIRWTLTGLWSVPSEQTQPTVDLTSFQPPIVATNTNTPTFTVNTVSLVLRDFSLDLGNDVQPRLLIGREEIKIVDRGETIQANVEAVPLTTLDPYTLAQARTKIAAVITHGTTAGSIATITAPTAQVGRMSGFENQQNILEWPLRLSPLPASGNDQFTLVMT